MKSLRHRVAVARGDARPLRGKRSTPYRLAVLGASLCGVGSGLVIKQKVTTPRKLTDLLVPTLNKSGIKSRIQGSFLKGIEKRPLGSGSSAARIQGCCRARPSFNAPAARDPPGPRPQPPTGLQLCGLLPGGEGEGGEGAADYLGRARDSRRKPCHDVKPSDTGGIGIPEIEVRKRGRKNARRDNSQECSKTVE